MDTLTAPLSLQHIHLAYGKQIIFDDLTLSLRPGKCTALLGPSGIGKSTLLKLAAGLIPSRISGEIFRGKISCDQPVAYMAQDDLLLPWLNALDNALVGIRLKNTVTQIQQQQVKKFFSQVSLIGAEKKFPHQLSGGMRQRVALIRTLMEDKSIILMDEPFSALDTITRVELQTLALELLKDRTILLVTHDPLEALRLANEIYILSGQPAKLKRIPELATHIPHSLADPDIFKYQSLLFAELTRAKEEIYA